LRSATVTLRVGQSASPKVPARVHRAAPPFKNKRLSSGRRCRPQVEIADGIEIAWASSGAGEGAGLERDRALGTRTPAAARP